jgi:hypothetical protein
MGEQVPEHGTGGEGPRRGARVAIALAVLRLAIGGAARPAVVAVW